MLFNSYIFVLLFLPLCVTVYFLLYRLGAKKLPQVWLFGMSLWFYGYFNPWYLIIICTSIVCNFFLARGLIKVRENPVLLKTLTALGVIGNLGLLFYFKYVDFLIVNINRLIQDDIPLRHILLPLGISFFTFQQLSYLIDTYRGETEDYSFLEYAVFVAFFPQLVAGPIVLHNEIIPQFRNPDKHKPNWDMISRGLWLFAVGLTKKVMLADTLGRMVTLGFGGVEILTCLDVILVAVAYALQLYFDFSGYSDMASGISSMFGITLPINFNSPYKSASIMEFWQRWHMTLTRFMRNYVYIPLGGNRKGKVRTSLNLIIVYILSGLWHGAGWTFIIWGLIHGVFQVLNRRFKKIWDRVPKPLAVASTFLFVAMALLIFRAENFGQVFIMFRKVIKLESLTLSPSFAEALTLPEVWLLERVLGIGGLLGGRGAIHMWSFLGLAIYITFFTKNAQEREFKTSFKTLIATCLMLAVCIVNFSGISTFLYFNF